MRERIVVLDGAMGTMIQGYKLSEADYRGERFRDWQGKDLKGMAVRCWPEMFTEYGCAVNSFCRRLFASW